MSDINLRVHNLPNEVDERELVGSTVVVIDVLRATSTICQALASGAQDVVPFVEIDDAIAAANQAGRKHVVLGGERKGVQIAGFDLGNSPTEYTREAVAGRRVFITTTNGTRALQHARLAKQVMIASFFNLSAVVAALKEEPRIDILCAGTDGVETSEDVLLAGAIVHKLFCSAEQKWKVNENVRTAWEEWQKLLFAGRMTDKSLNQLVTISLEHSQGGMNILQVGNAADIPACAKVDSLNIVPELDIKDWRITVR